VTARLSDSLTDEPLGQHDREHHDRDDAAGVEQELHGEQEWLVEQEEDHAGRHQRRREVEDGVKEVRREHDGEARGE